jgi:hypothetical protein
LGKKIVGLVGHDAALFIKYPAGLPSEMYKRSHPDPGRW